MEQSCNLSIVCVPIGNIPNIVPLDHKIYAGFEKLFPARRRSAERSFPAILYRTCCAAFRVKSEITTYTVAGG